MSVYRELPAPPPLRAEVECRWRTAVAAGAPPRTGHVLPDGCTDLLRLDGQVVAAGPDAVAHTVRQQPGTAVHGLPLHPGVPLADLL